MAIQLGMIHAHQDVRIDAGKIEEHTTEMNREVYITVEAQESE